MADISDALDRVAEQLYAERPGGFIAARDAAVKDARSQGDRDLAGQIKALRRPTVAAWALNVLARSDGGLTELADLSDQLRDAQARLDGAAMKTLGAQRNSVVAQLTSHAVTLAAEADASYQDSPATREQITATLNAAVADPAAERAVTSGRLVSALSYAGFGEVDLTDAVATPLRAVPVPSNRTTTTPAPQGTDDRTREAATAGESGLTAEPPAVDERALTRAQARVTDAERRLTVAQEAYAQARARRHQARLDVERAQQALDELTGPG